MSVREIKELHKSDKEKMFNEVAALAEKIEKKVLPVSVKKDTPAVLVTSVRHFCCTRLKTLCSFCIGDVVVDYPSGHFFECVDIFPRNGSFTVYFKSVLTGQRVSAHIDFDRDTTDRFFEVTGLLPPYPECATLIGSNQDLADVREVSEYSTSPETPEISEVKKAQYEFMGKSAPYVAAVNEVEMTAQQNLKFGNDDERITFLQNYHKWTVYAEIPAFGLKYYRVGLSNGEYIVFEAIGNSYRPDAFRIISDKKPFGLFGIRLKDVSEYLRQNKLSAII
jgi:hypothetical protein